MDMTMDNRISLHARIRLTCRSFGRALLVYEATGRAAKVREIEQFVLDHMDMLYGIAFQLTQEAVEARELTELVVAKALRYHHTLKNGAPIKGWLLTLLRNTFIEEYRPELRQTDSASAMKFSSAVAV